MQLERRCRVKQKVAIIALIGLMSAISAALVWKVSTLDDGEILEPASWDGADSGYGAVTIILVGLLGIFYVATRVRIREIG